MSYWILKSEPSAYSFDDLTRDQATVWDGVRNYQARNNLKLMRIGDLAMIYHSVGPRELVGIAKVEQSAFKDASATVGDWVAVGVKFLRRFKKPVNLASLRSDPRLTGLSLIKQSRLSVCPVSEQEWRVIIELSEQP